MNAWFLLRRARGPAFLILLGFTALLNQWGVLSFSRSWPLYLILAGLFGLAERGLLAIAPPPPPLAYPTYAVPPAPAPPPPPFANPAASVAEPTPADPFSPRRGNP